MLREAEAINKIQNKKIIEILIMVHTNNKLHYMKKKKKKTKKRCTGCTPDLQVVVRLVVEAACVDIDDEYCKDYDLVGGMALG